MTRKDYNRAAEMVRELSAGRFPRDITQCAPMVKGGFSQSTVEDVAVWQMREAFVVFFAGDNPDFDADRFRAACLP